MNAKNALLLNVVLDEVKILAIMTCYGKEIIQNDFEYDTIGFAYRDRDGLHIIFNFFNEIIVIFFLLNIMKKMDYAEFLCQPYFKEISMRKLLVRDNSKELPKILFKNTKLFVEKLTKDSSCNNIGSFNI